MSEGCTATQASLASAGGHAASVRLGRLVTRLASSVRVVEVDEEQGPFSAPVREALHTLEGKPLTFEGWRAVLLSVAREAKTSRVGVLLVCRRQGDGTGVKVSASSRAERDIAETSSRCWSHDTNIRLGERPLRGSAGGSAWEYLMAERAYEDDEKSIKELLAASAEDAWRITIELVPQR
jgi:hypothetical protein